MGFVIWILVALIAGWLAAQVMKGGGYGVLVDIILGTSGELSEAGFSAGWESGRAAALSDRSSWHLSGR